MKKISKLCYQLLRELPDRSEEATKLNYLAQESSLSCPQITAGNAINIKFLCFFNIIGSIVSYVIVLIQFEQS